MKKERLEVTRGSGNVYRDLGHANADVKQLKALLAAEILKALDREKLSVRQAHGAYRDCRCGLLAYPERRSGAVHAGQVDVDHQPARLPRGSQGEGEAAWARCSRRDSLNGKNSMRCVIPTEKYTANQMLAKRPWAAAAKPPHRCLM